MRRRIRLTEGQLMDIIEEATMRVIQEAGMLRGAAKYVAQNPGAKMFQRSNNANQNQRPLQQIFYGTNTKPSKEALARIPANTDDGSRMWAAVNQNPEKFGMTRNQLMQHKQNMQNPETQKWLKGYANAVKQGNQGTNNSMFQRSNNANQNQGNSMFQRSNATRGVTNAVRQAGQGVSRLFGGK